MKRAVLTSLMVLLFASVWQTVANHVPDWLNVFFLPPLVLVFTLQFYRPLETILTCLISGFFIDVISGLMVGSNMALMLIATFLLSATSLFAGRIERQHQIFYVVAMSFLYRLVLLFVGLVFMAKKANISFLQLIIGPIVDGLLSIIFYKFLFAMLSLFKAIDQSDFYNNRLGLRR